jgi:hypothetical protein
MLLKHVFSIVSQSLVVRQFFFLSIEELTYV